MTASESPSRLPPDPSLAAIVLAAGRGTRMGGDHAKVLAKACGAPILHYVLDSLVGVRPQRTVLVLGHRAEEVRESLAGAAGGERGIEFVLQPRPQGTGDAVHRCRDALSGFEGDILVLYGDVPGLRPATVRGLLARHRREDAEATILAASVPSPRGYGRVLRGPDGKVRAIVEDAQASPEELRIEEVNVGPCVLRSRDLWDHLEKLPEEGPKRERQLTSVIARLIAAGRRVAVHGTDDSSEGWGVNSLEDLSRVRCVLQDRILADHLRRGVCIEDPRTTTIDRDVRIGSGTVIHPCTVIEGQVEIGRDCEIGPFTHLRTGARLEDTAEVGNFTEMKNASLGPGSKAKHLTYLGDAVIGSRVNVGAGTITANYDGHRKSVTRIADGAFVGSGTILVAPVSLGARSVTGAGAVVVKHTPVGEDEVFVGVPARRLDRPGGEPGSGNASRGATPRKGPVE